MPGESYSNAGTTITLVAQGDTKQGYAVESGGAVTKLIHAELVRQVECEPGTPAASLPPDSNRRVGRAVSALAEKLAPGPEALEPRRRDSEVTRPVNTRLGQLRLHAQPDPDHLQRLEEMGAAFNAELLVSVSEGIKLSCAKKRTRRASLSRSRTAPPEPSGRWELRTLRKGAHKLQR